jgi:hypothetical protein
VMRSAAWTATTVPNNRAKLTPSRRNEVSFADQDRANSAHRPDLHSRIEARRVAANIAKLPELLG